MESPHLIKKKLAKEKSPKNFFALLLVAEDTRILFADQDFAEKISVRLPAWQGQFLAEYLPCAKAGHLFTSAALKHAAETRQEITCFLQNGLRILISVRSFLASTQMLRSLLQDAGFVEEDIGVVEGERIYLLSCLCVDHIGHFYRSAAEVKLRSTIGSIISGFAHEVRNPLTAIVSLTEGAMHPQMDEESLRALSRIPPLVERIENLIKIALSYGRPRPPKAAWYRLETLLLQAVETLSQAGMPLPPNALPRESLHLPVYVDIDHAMSILTNLIQNAMEEAGLDGVQIVIDPQPALSEERYLYCSGSLVAIDVYDQGRGVSDAHHESIFEPFFTTKSNGTGLGLALARDLARLNNGDVLLLETSPQGSIFRLLLPTYPREHEAAS